MMAYAQAMKDKNLAFIFGEYGAVWGDLGTHKSTKNVYTVALTYNIGRLYWDWSNDGMPVVDRNLPGVVSGMGYEIDRWDGTRPTNLSWFGGIVWDDSHGTLTLPIPPYSFPIIVNGGFEDGLNGWWNIGSPLTHHPGQSYNGSACARLRPGAGYSGQDLDVDNLIPGATYKFSAWAKTSDTTFDEKNMSVIGLAYKTAADVADTNVDLNFYGTEWTYLEKVFTFAETIYSARLFMWQPNANVDFWFDEIELELIDILPTPTPTATPVPTKPQDPEDTVGFTAIYDAGVVAIATEGFNLAPKTYMLRVVAIANAGSDKYLHNIVNVYKEEIFGGNFAKSVDVGKLDFVNFTYKIYLTDFDDNLYGQTTVQDVPLEVFVPVDIEIISLPKLSYRIDEDFNAGGLAIKVLELGNYGTERDGETVAYPAEGLSVSGFVKGVVGDQTITVTYGAFSKTFVVNVRYINVTLGEEKAGGAGYERSITIEDGVNLTGMYIVARVQNGSGEAANIMVMTISAASTAIVSYQRAGSTVDVWLASGLLNLTGGNLNATIYGHAVVN